MSSMTWDIGSDPDADLWLEDAAISWRHCRLQRTDTGHLIEDLGSTNGTLVNGSPIEHPTAVTAADKILLAGQIPLPWPDRRDARQVISIGQDDQNMIQVKDQSVSRKHAELIVDPNGQMIVKDLGSTNGTWIGEQSIRAVLVHDDSPFRVGVTTLTAAQIKSKLGEAFVGHGKPGWNNSQKAMLAIVPVFVLVAFAAMAMFRHHVTSNHNSEVAASQLVDAASMLENRAAPIADHDIPNETTLEPTAPPSTQPSADTNETSNAESAQTLQDEPDPQTAPETENAPETEPQATTTTTALTSNAVEANTIEANDSREGLDRVRYAMFRVVAKVNDADFDFASAWAAKPALLITNAHVVGQMQTHAMRAVHLQSGNEASIESLGIHPLYAVNAEKLQAAFQDIARLETEAKADQTPDQLDAIAAKIGERKRELPWLQSAVDSYNIGWIRLNAPVSEASYLPLEPLTIGRKKLLKLTNPFIEKDTFEAIDNRSVSFVTVRTVGLTIQKDSDSPVCWCAQIQSASDDWTYCLFDGCPLIDTHGRLAGMYRGAARAATSGETEAIETKIDMVPLSVIKSVVQSF